MRERMLFSFWVDLFWSNQQPHSEQYNPFIDDSIVIEIQVKFPHSSWTPFEHTLDTQPDEGSEGKLI